MVRAPEGLHRHDEYQRAWYPLDGITGAHTAISQGTTVATPGGTV
jgi:hypothetical protein